MGIDSKITVAVVMRSDGSAIEFSGDDDPSGGSGEAPTLDRFDCASATIEHGSDGIDRVLCSGAGTRTHICPAP